MAVPLETPDPSRMAKMKKLNQWRLRLRIVAVVSISMAFILNVTQSPLCSARDDASNNRCDFPLRILAPEKSKAMSATDQDIFWNAYYKIALHVPLHIVLDCFTSVAILVIGTAEILLGIGEGFEMEMASGVLQVLIPGFLHMLSGLMFVSGGNQGSSAVRLKSVWVRLREGAMSVDNKLGLETQRGLRKA
ncbi:hypothetical protein K469DRAFT_753200 [Zopfia rhizophila CBS 207.26]|uniref:Uncharacterized protein n=1 Tax=Zopfia rhizophila CBS 207.26 TaxID=1314779 RepID=A0A6A6DLZ4_9PEZI|nr:hypothetical protein K469DRAFT_753200 [Zopfia rhizophila CBS 207.26]